MSEKPRRFSHRTTLYDMKVMYRRLAKLNIDPNHEFDEEDKACYFTMCLLLPKENFLNDVKSLGGFNIVRSSREKLEFLAKKYKVETTLVYLRLEDLQSREEKIEEKQKGTSKVIIKKNISISLIFFLLY